MVSKANFCLATISQGFKGKFLLGDRQSWLQIKLFALQPPVMYVKVNYASQLFVIVAKRNSCWATVSDWRQDQLMSVLNPQGQFFQAAQGFTIVSQAFLNLRAVRPI